MSLNFFKPEDFYGKPDFPLPQDMKHLVADIANAKLVKLIESWPIIHGRDDISMPWWNAPIKEATHRARLAFIESIESQYAEAKITIDKERFIEETKKLVDEAISKAWRRLEKESK